jgi:hypothetical protein
MLGSTIRLLTQLRAAILEHLEQQVAHGDRSGKELTIPEPSLGRRVGDE